MKLEAMKKQITLAARVLVLAVVVSTQMAHAKDLPTGLMQDTGRSSVMAQLITVASATPGTDKAKADVTIVGIRGGGGTGKPLGQYLVKPNLEFRSDYKKESTETMCQFAYDLHQFVKLKGGDWPSMQRNNGLDYVPYEKQKEFASFWWLRNKKNFKDMPGIGKDWFLNDALIDATNLYNWYARREYGSADYVSWEDVAVSSLMKKKP